MKRFIVIFALAFASTAAANDVTGIVFVPQPVRAPVAPDRVMPVAPFVPSGVGERTGVIDVGPDRAATLWLDALDVVQVRKVGGGGKVLLARVVGAAKTRATIAESGVAAASGITYLAQPPGGGDVWMIWADKPATIHVERPVVRDGRAIWETTQRALLAWVESGGARPAIPVVDGAYAAVLRIDADASTGAAIEALEPAQRAAVRAWRKASIVAELAAIRPFVMPQLRVEPLDSLEGMGAAVTVLGPRSIDPEPYRRVEKPRTIEVELEGPGALRIEARALLPAPRGGVSNAAELPDVSIAIASEGAVAARRTVAATYATERDDRDDSIAPEAFPSKQPLKSKEGDTLGERVMVAVPLYPGKHRYRIVLDGGALAVRATVARHRPRMTDAIRTDSVDEHLADARDAIAGGSPGARLVRALIDARAGKSLPANGAAPKLPASLQAAWLAATGDVRDRAALADAVKTADKAHAWIHALAIARRLPDGDAVRALYAAVPGAPPASLVPDLVALLPRSTPLERVRNWPLAATLSASRTRPTDPTVTAAVRARWRAGEWAQLRPALDGRDDDLPASRRWLVEAEAQPLAVPRAWRGGDLVRLEPNQPRTVTATASTLDGSRAALLDVYVTAAEPPAGEQHPIDIIVDGKRMQTLALAPVERVQIAVTPGAHEVKIAGPKSLRGWVSQLPTAPVDAADRARVQSMWPAVLDGTRMKFALPATDLPIEVTLRVAGANRDPLRVAIRTDVGPATELAITSTARDARARAVDALSGEVSEELSFVVWPARGAKTVWIDSSDASRIVASIATRRERTMAKRVLPSSKNMITSDLLGRVERASKTLATDPQDASALASRANDLLDLGEPSLAREDLIRLLKLPAAKKLASSAAIEEELFARLDESSDYTHVALAKRAEQPVLVGPALAVLVTEKLEGALPAAIAARKELAAGNTLGAAKLLVGAYQATDRWPIALEAVDLLTRVLTDRKTTPPAGLISLTYGLAARTKLSIDTPRIRRALVVSATQSGWDTLNAVSTSAGHEVVLSTRPILPPAPAVLVREALVAPSWQARTAHTLTPGNAGVLDLALPAAMTLRAQVHCVRVRPDHARTDEPCNFTVRVDNGTPKPSTAPFGKTIDLPIALAAGRRVVEVALASEGDAASVRFVSEREIAGVTDPADAQGVFPVRIERRTKLFTASTQVPITTSVQGPATLWIQARALAGASTAEVLATSSTSAPVKATLRLVADRDDDARGDGRDLRISTPSDVFLVLPDATTYLVAVKPDKGELAARMALRDERRTKAPRAPGPWYTAAPTEVAAFSVALPPTIGAIEGETYEPPAMGRAGTLSIDLRAEQDTRGDEDVASREPGNYIEAGVGFRRSLSARRLWLNTRAGIRAREETNAIANGAAELYVDQLPLGATLQLAGIAYTQSFSEGRAWHVRGRARLGARWDLTDTLTARPTLGFGASYLNTTADIAAVAMDRLDPDVYSGYRDTHARDANGAFNVQWMPLQDLVGQVGLNATTNQDFSLARLDYAGANIGFRMLAPLPFLGDTMIATSYRPNYRFSDDHRPSGYWRHDIVTRIEWSVWTTTQGRFVLSAWDEYHPGKRNSFGAGIRFDLVRHRGLADFSPNDAPFASLIDDRAYAPLETP
ncbi:MAG: hypothetical protein M4D80_23790 [Myxococcota bacterium]|nr:hypothetical protein [Myxococcota bacterium]